MPKNVEFIDFFAPWCGPCRLMAPVMEEIEKEYKDKIKISKINIDENQEEASKYQVMSIPTILILKDGKVANQLIGMQQKEAIVEAINTAIK